MCFVSEIIIYYPPNVENWAILKCILLLLEFNSIPVIIILLSGKEARKKDWQQMMMVNECVMFCWSIINAGHRSMTKHTLILEWKGSSVFSHHYIWELWKQIWESSLNSVCFLGMEKTNISWYYR